MAGYPISRNRQSIPMARSPNVAWYSGELFAAELLQNGAGGGGIAILGFGILTLSSTTT